MPQAYKGMETAKSYWDKGEKIYAIKLLRANNEGLGLKEARCALDAEYAEHYAEITVIVHIKQPMQNEVVDAIRNIDGVLYIEKE